MQTVIETESGYMIRCPVCGWHEFPKIGKPRAIVMIGKRITLSDDHEKAMLALTPGEYYGPIMGYTGDVPAIFFVPPAGDYETRLHHVCSPPHKFFEQPDGTLTIKDSIGCGPRGNYYWHGYLTNGVWHKC